MTNYEKLTRAMPKQLADIIAKLLQNPDAIQDAYCEHCDKCQKSDKCSVTDEETVLWWLNQAVKK